MAQCGPRRADRQGLSLMELYRMFPDDAAAERWFVESRWPGGVCCPKCDSGNIQHRETRKPQPYRCRDCRKDFSVRTGTPMHGSNVGYQKWAFAFYLMLTGLKGTSSMKLHRDLGVTQKTAWHMAHRIRECWSDRYELFEGPVEMDEVYIGGKEINKHESRRLRVGGGSGGKSPVVGIKDRDTNQVVATPMESVTARNVEAYAGEFLDDAGVTVYTDESRAYSRIGNRESVNHSAGEYVRGKAHTNGIESFWAMLKRGYQGTFHWMSRKHLHRNVNEFAGRHNIRNWDTLDQMSFLAFMMDGKRLRHKDLIA